MSDWRTQLPIVRGKLLRDEPLAPFTWFRVGGAAELLFLPADADDLAAFLKGLPADVPVTVLGVGSNVIVRDGGVRGRGDPPGRPRLRRRRGRAATRITAGAAALDAAVARAAAKAGIAGLEFYAGMPGTIGGALTMNAGCYGAETKDVLVSAWGYDRSGDPAGAAAGRLRLHLSPLRGAGRHHLGRGDLSRAARTIRRPSRRAWPRSPRGARQTQPIREKTGGSTFKNPPGPFLLEAGRRGGLARQGRTVGPCSRRCTPTS